MIYKLLLIAFLLIFTACGENYKTTKDKSIDSNISVDNDNNISAGNNTLNTNFKPSPKTITIYIHGYREEGYAKEGDYGKGWYNTFSTNLKNFTTLPMIDYEDIPNYNRDSFYNFLTSVDYYGETMPSYYSQEDGDEVEQVSKEYGGGIPKYALIVAKYAKYLLKETGAERLNIISVSMGSLVTRWMIEKNLENLSSDKKIEKWLSVEGVVRGNYAISQVSGNSFMNLFLTNSPDTDHMKYEWIKENLNPNPNEMNSPYYNDILVGQISLTDGTQENSLIKYILPLYGGFQPNDGFQLLKDTYFDSIKNSIQTPTHTILHGDHVDIKSNYGAFANMASFLDAKKRVRVTLIETTVTDIHEDITSSNIGSEIVFESYILSEKAKERWAIEEFIDERVYESGALKIHNYNEVGATYALNEILFDSFVLNDETELEVTVEGYEIDRSTLYDISETNEISKKESLGETNKIVPLKNGVYDISAQDWSGKLRVEVLEM
jgi:hypothetical protein